MIVLLYLLLVVNVSAGSLTFAGIVNDHDFDEFWLAFVVTIFLTPANIIWLAQL